MAVTKNTKQQAAPSRQPRTKMLGTRVGTLDDWRKAGGKGAGEGSARGSRLRNGQ